MKPMVNRMLVAGTAWTLLAFTSGCQTTDSADAKSTEEQDALVIQEEKEWRDPPIGSHMKRRRRVNTAQDPSVTRPAMGGKITDETDTLVMPPTAGQMEGGRPGG